MSGAVATRDALAPDAGLFAARVEWQAVALGANEWPEEGADAAVALFLECAFVGADYLLGAGAGAEDGWRLWRMNMGDSDWRFLGRFDRWPDRWMKAGEAA